MLTVPDFVNEAAIDARLSRLDRFLVEENLSAPIDEFRVGLSSLLQFGTIERLRESEFLGALLTIKVVAAAEAYFRAALAGAVEMCPVCHAMAADQNVNLGGLLWHGKSGYSRTAFENASFSSKEELIKACKNFVGFDLKDAMFQVPLQQYDMVCHIRHGIVHGDGVMPGRNAVRLGIPRCSSPVRIVVRYEQLQDVAAVVNSLVITFNRALFDLMCKRWSIDWRQRSDWIRANERAVFLCIWKLFHSKEEVKQRKGRSKITPKECMAALKRQYKFS